MDKILSTVLVFMSLGVFCVLQSEASVFVFLGSLVIHGAHLFVEEKKIEKSIDARLVHVLEKHDEVSKKVQDLEKDIASMNKMSNLKKMGI